MTAVTRYPAISKPRANDAQSLVRSIIELKEVVEILNGSMGTDNPYRALTLYDYGITTKEKYRTFSTDIQSGGGGLSGDFPDVETLQPVQQPENLTASGAFYSVILDWDAATYGGHAYTEIFRSGTDDFGTSVRVGTSESSVYSDDVDAGGTYYYWIRFVRSDDEVGAINATAGTLATTALIDATQIANDLIDTQHLVDNAIEAVKIATGAITQTKITDGAISTSKLAALAITADKIASNAVTTDKIAANSITAASGILGDLAVLTAKIADAAVTNAKIANLAVDSAKISNAAITEAKIASAAITAAKIASAAITTAKIVNAAVTNAKIANLAVTGAKIQDAAITSAKIQDAAIGTLKLAGQSVTIKETIYVAGPLEFTDVDFPDFVSDQITIDNSVATSAVEIRCDFLLSYTAPTQGNPGIQVDIRVTRNGSEIRRWFGEDLGGNFPTGDNRHTLVHVDKPGSGTFTYRFQIKSIDTFTDVYVSDVYMSLDGAKR